LSEELRQQVLEYINSHDHCVIATSREDKPRAATVVYANDGFDIIVHTIRGTAKHRNVEVNSNVALVIDDQAREGRGKTKTLQYVGKAKILANAEEQQKVAEIYIKRFPIVKDMLTPEGFAKDQILIRITPERIYFSDYAKGVGHREKLTTF